jgi:hypothetical protein
MTSKRNITGFGGGCLSAKADGFGYVPIFHLDLIQAHGN